MFIFQEANQISYNFLSVFVYKRHNYPRKFHNLLLNISLEWTLFKILTTIGWNNYVPIYTKNIPSFNFNTNKNMITLELWNHTQSLNPHKTYLTNMKMQYWDDR